MSELDKTELSPMPAISEELQDSEASALQDLAHALGDEDFGQFIDVIDFHRGYHWQIAQFMGHVLEGVYDSKVQDDLNWELDLIDFSRDKVIEPLLSEIADGKKVIHDYMSALEEAGHGQQAKSILNIFGIDFEEGEVTFNIFNVQSAKKRDTVMSQVNDIFYFIDPDERWCEEPLSIHAIGSYGMTSTYPGQFTRYETVDGLSVVIEMDSDES